MLWKENTEYLKCGTDPAHGSLRTDWSKLWFLWRSGPRPRSNHARLDCGKRTQNYHSLLSAPLRKPWSNLAPNTDLWDIHRTITQRHPVSIQRPTICPLPKTRALQPSQQCTEQLASRTRGATGAVIPLWLDFQLVNSNGSSSTTFDSPGWEWRKNRLGLIMAL